MIDSIFIALTGLRGYERGLKTIANNTANLNTPGFKGSSLLFADMYTSGGGLTGSGSGSLGLGLDTLGTVLSFHQGQMQSTDDGLDLAVDGQGMFVVRNAEGQIRYTRDGQFKFNTDGILVTQAGDEQVMALGDGGTLVPVSLGSVRVSGATPTSRMSFGGNLSASSTGPSTYTVSNVTVYDAMGTAHTVSVQFSRALTDPTGQWTVTVLEGTASVVAGQLLFTGGILTSTATKPSFRYPLNSPDGQGQLIEIDCTTNLTAYGSTTTSSVSLMSQDGRVPGTLTGTAFDASGRLRLSYSNGNTAQGVQLALARFESIDAVRAVGDNRFEAVDPANWVTGVAGQNGFGNIKSSMVEMSNVDLSSEFAELVIMQRGYQASSQVVSTANEMLAELYGMKGK